MKNNHRQIDLMANEYGLFMAKNNIMKKKNRQKMASYAIGGRLYDSGLRTVRERYLYMR